MYDTIVTLLGNVMTAPEWRRTAATGTYVVTFRFASTSRRFDRASERWIDGDSLRLKVACWRKLGQNVFHSVQLGDPLLIQGRLYSRDWTDGDGNRHTSYELDALSVGHDLSRGVAQFARRKAVGATDSVNDPANEGSIGGEASQAVEPPERPADLARATAGFEPFDSSRFDTSVVVPPGYVAPAEEDLDRADDDVDGDLVEDEAAELGELSVRA
jgi:single-strand DNA-binding protein